MNVSRFARVTILCMSLLACQAAFAETSYLKPGDTILTIGDSISSADGYQNYMRELLASLYAPEKIVIVNTARSGMTASAGVGQIQQCLDGGIRPTIITVKFGVNDTRWRNEDAEAKTEAFIANMTKIADFAAELGIPLIILRETHFSHNALEEDFVTQANLILERLLQAQDAFAAERGIPVIDVHSAYRRALAAAWAADLRYEFTPDVIHPTDPGHAAIAAEILRALGVGLPLSTNERSPVRVDRDDSIVFQALDAVGVVEPGQSITLQVSVRNTTARPVGGTAGFLFGKSTQHKAVSLAAYEAKVISIEIPASALEERSACKPLYMTFAGEGIFTASHALLHYSKMIPTAAEAHVITADEFGVWHGPYETRCPVSRTAVRYTGDSVRIEFTWRRDNPVHAQTPFANRFRQRIDTPLDLSAAYGQPCDAIEFYFDTRPDASAGRRTSNIDSDPEGVIRLGVYTVNDDTQPLRVLLPEGIAEDAARLEHIRGDTYALHLDVASQGSALGFSMRVSAPFVFGLGRGPVYFLGGRYEPMSYLRLNPQRAGVIYRLGY